MRRLINKNILPGMLLCLLSVMLGLSLACPKPNEQNNVLVPKTNYRIAVVSGNNQSGPLNAKLAAPLVVHVADENQVSQPSVPVTFDVTEGWGDLTPKSSISDTAGLAPAELTPTYAPGEIKVRARVSGSDLYLSGSVG